ncbi:uncharacterized protein PGTG_17863 [Puccinia graminis f. sp. tritici CRL 75-36-700-3]|uniref:Uncharacterized protein n=1 Tax=Puccinia graminis f. sp. tritici (strain CRL 75-36-700-3 / race SCCL) TaxID=418459 RepID=E3L657_PUCGT|nr:uncharacterized protein PGTG_17863 [Puccinia graminis f. sp. tritici CRL 75-36-700-3]EFP92032.2 hypothetical protein PGTG_17863 [Puccinia graminis f. sp. tritici CRL 75-36-700-3]
MDLCATALRVTLVLVLVSIAHAQRRARCPNTQTCGGKGIPLSEEERTQMSLKLRDLCGWEYQDGHKCKKECDKTYYSCMTCHKIFSKNTAWDDRSKLGCEHAAKRFVAIPAPSGTKPGPSEPGPSEPDNRPPVLYHFI